MNKEITKKLDVMFQMQHDLNVNVYDKDWYKNRTTQDLVRAIWAEAVELMDSLPWKWWATPNMKNAQIECVDLWHFIMSFILLTKNIENDTKSASSHHLTLSFLAGLELKSDTIQKILGQSFSQFLLTQKDSDKRVLFITEEFVKAFLNYSPNIGCFLFGALINEIFSFDQLYNFYIGKNILNKVRQELGYKKGEYTKALNGMQDNDYLYELVLKFNDVKRLEKEIRRQMKSMQS